MGLGNMLGSLGGAGDIMGKLSESGIDASAIKGLDAEGVKALLAEKGIDLSMLEGFGLSVDDIMAKITGS